MSNCLGFDGKLYFNETMPADNQAATIDGLSSWVEMTGSRDVSTTASADAAETSDRGSVFKNYCQGMIDLETTVTCTYRAGSAQDSYLATLRDHMIARTSVYLAVMDGDIATTGSQGFCYAAHVTSNDFDQALTDGMTISITFKPAYQAGVDPVWHTSS